ncbi:MAG: ABC transporter permease [Cyclobacteriaceae bacterium]
MLLHQLIYVVRTIQRDLSFNLVNILGLGLGLVVASIAITYFPFETSFDQFHENSDRIFRINTDTYQNNELVVSNARTFNAAKQALSDDISQIDDITQVYIPDWRTIIEFGNDKLECKPIWVDQSFLNIFSFELKSGSPSAFNDPTSIFITQSLATKLFGTLEVLGQHVSFNTWGDQEFVIAGVLANPPDNSHLKFEVVMPLAFAENKWNWPMSWRYREFYTYALLSSDKDVEIVSNLANTIVSKHLPSTSQDKLHFQAIGSIHLDKPRLYEPTTAGDFSTLYTVLVFALSILIISIVNYINFTVAKTLQRRDRLEIFRILGSGRSHIFSLYLIDAFLIFLSAFFLGVTITSILSPAVNQFFDTELIGLSNPDFVLIVFVLCVCCAAATSIICWLLNSRVVVSQSGNFVWSGSQAFKKSLIAFQFVCTLGLIIGTVIGYSQLRYMQNQPLGFDTANVMAIYSPDLDVEDSTHLLLRKRFKTALIKYPFVKNIAVSNALPGSGQKDLYTRTGELSVDSKSIISQQEFYMFGIDEDFLETIGVKLLAGTDFQEGDSTWVSGIIINETAARALGFSDPTEALNETIKWSSNRQLKIRGIVEDYHHHSLRNPVPPIVMRITPPFFYNYFLVKMDLTNWDQVAIIKEEYEKLFPGQMFSEFFVDEKFDEQYRADRKLITMLSTFSGLAILVGAIGLLVLSALLALQMTKEIGIRKVLGASLFNIIAILSKGFIQLYLIAVIIVVPSAVILGNSWLNEFPYRTEFHYHFVVIPILLLFIVLFAVVFIQVIRAAMRNPVLSLKYE